MPWAAGVALTAESPLSRSADVDDFAETMSETSAISSETGTAPAFDRTLGWSFSCLSGEVWSVEGGGVGGSTLGPGRDVV